MSGIKGISAMRIITLDSETDFDGWRRAARVLATHDIGPAEVAWSVQGRKEVPAGLSEPSVPFDNGDSTFSVPAHFLDLARIAILHSNSERFALLYRLLWRLKTDHGLLATMTDPEVAQ